MARISNVGFDEIFNRFPNFRHIFPSVDRFDKLFGGFRRFEDVPGHRFDGFFRPDPEFSSNFRPVPEFRLVSNRFRVRAAIQGDFWADSLAAFLLGNQQLRHD